MWWLQNSFSYMRSWGSLPEFDFQWKSLPCKLTEYSLDRIKELLEMTQLRPDFFKGKHCLDAGCGNGRYTYALLKLGAKVDSFDISQEAVQECRKVNPDAFVFDLMDLTPNPKYDFIFCFGVIHHLLSPYEAFRKLCSQLKEGGTLFLMVYHVETQPKYEVGRIAWQLLSSDEKTKFCEMLSKQLGGEIHTWYDALNPKYNWSFYPYEIEEWFKAEGFQNIKLAKTRNINMRGIFRRSSLSYLQILSIQERMRVRRVGGMFRKEKRFLSRLPYPSILFAMFILKILSIFPEQPIMKIFEKGEHGHIDTVLKILTLKRAW